MIDGNELTIVPQFQDAKTYHISIPRGAVVGLNGKDFGGLADYTGLAWLDGTPSKPELVLNARDTENFIQLKDVLADLRGFKGKSEQSEKYGDTYYDVQINVDKISNDYDVEQLANKIKKIIHKDSMYRNVNAINFLR